MNKVILIGNLSRDPEMRTTTSGVSVCSFGLAVNRRRKVEGQPDADFFNVTAWRQLGENCARYLQKGRKVCVVGSVQLRTYDARDGGKRTAVDVLAEDVEFLPSAESQPAKADVQRPYMPSTEDGFTVVQEDELPF